jgi:ABC-type glycerol-3-phosphate transport system substrate-binding protein
MNKDKRLYLIVAILASVGLLFTACQPEIVEVIKEVPVESIVVKEVEVQKIVEVEKEVEKIVEVEVSADAGAPALAYKGELSVLFTGGYGPAEGLTDVQKAAGATGNSYTAALIADWEDMHPGIDVVPFPEPQSPPGAQTANIWFMQTAIAAGEGPDIYTYYGTGTYDGMEGDKGLLYPIGTFLRQPNPYVAAGQPGSDAWIDMWVNEFTGIMAQSKSPGGKYYSIPLETAAPSLMYYNKTKLDEYGLTFPQPTYIGELVELLKTLDSKGHTAPMGIMCCSPASNWDSLMFDHSIIEPMALENWQLDYNPAMYDNLFEQEEFARAVIQGNFAATDPEFVDTLRLAKSWVPYVTEEWKQGDQPQLANFLSGEYLVRISGSWEAEAIFGSDALDFEVGVASGPVVGMDDSEYALEEEPGPFVGGPAGAYVINNAAADRGTLLAAIDFMQYYTTQLSVINQGNPGLVPVLKNVTPNVRPEVAGPAAAHIPTGHMRWSSADHVDQEAREVVFSVLQEAYMDLISLEEAAEVIQEQWVAWAERMVAANSTENGGSWDLSQW